jgi:alpha-tubulin suppressor-like RCC1 family protein
VVCWGDNTQNQLGNASAAGGISPPNQVANLYNIVQISTGYAHTCAVMQSGTDARVHCWGRAQEYQLGSNHELGSRASALEVPGPANVGFTAGGDTSTCSVSTGGTVWCWGTNYQGELGSACGNECAASQVPGLSNVQKLTVGIGSACATLAGNTIQCWGALPDGTIQSAPTPRTDLKGATVVSLGITSSSDVQTDPTLITLCAGFADGTAKCSYGTAIAPSTVTGLSNVKDLTVGRGHACALLKGGTIQCWGKNASGQLGNGSYADSASPVAVAAP